MHAYVLFRLEAFPWAQPLARTGCGQGRLGSRLCGSQARAVADTARRAVVWLARPRGYEAPVGRGGELLPGAMGTKIGRERDWRV